MPEDHHYVPQFYLNNWTSGQDKKLWCSKKVHKNKVVHSRIHPRSTAYEPDLNSLKECMVSGVQKEHINTIEERSKYHDNDASVILKKMIEKGVDDLTFKDKNIWTHFCLTLYIRTPNLLNTAEESGSEIMKEVIEEEKSKSAYPKNWEKTFKLFKNSNHCYNLSRLLIYKHMNDIGDYEKENPRIWKIFTLNDTNHNFFTSTKPLISDGKHHNPDGASILEIALNPKKLLITYPKTFDMDKEFSTILLMSYNLRLIQLSPDYIYSLNKIENTKTFRYLKAIDKFLPLL